MWRERRHFSLIWGSEPETGASPSLMGIVEGGSHFSFFFEGQVEKKLEEVLRGTNRLGTFLFFGWPEKCGERGG